VDLNCFIRIQGKSTFFNAATAFARQRGGDDVDDDGIAIGGATMAPHPFTTIDPNVGFCLVPAPSGSCPEDETQESSPVESIACSHGRDSFGRRLIPVMLKDVAGLVPGAYQGRGRGNKVRSLAIFDAMPYPVGILKNDSRSVSRRPYRCRCTHSRPRR